MKAITPLCKLITYKDSATCFRAIESGLVNLWSKVGDRASNKEEVPILCTFGPKGQGKTELCRQIVLRNDLHCKISGVKKMIAIHVSFNQTTSYATHEDTYTDVLRSVLWRSYRAFDEQKYQNDDPNLEYPPFDKFLQLVRSAHCSATLQPEEIGVFILLDEIMNITKEDRRRSLLNECGSVQQRELNARRPTFFLITSLQYYPMFNAIKTQSGRDLCPVPLPLLLDQSLDEMGDRITEYFIFILSYEKSENERKKLVGKKDVERLIRVVVSICGRHFRTLEFAIKSIYCRIVPLDQHRIWTSYIETTTTPVFATMAEMESFQADSKDVYTIALHDIFQSTLSNIRPAEEAFNIYHRLKELFMILLHDPDYFVPEYHLIDLLSVGAVFVKDRSESDYSNIVPRVCLPYLYFCPPVNIVRNSKKIDGYLVKSEAISLDKHIPMLLYNIGQALYKPREELPYSFECVMLWIELLRIASMIQRQLNPLITISDVLCDCEFNGWDEETLDSIVVAPFIFERSFVLDQNATTPLLHTADREQQLLLSALAYAFVSPEVARLSQKANLNMKGIEYINTCYVKQNSNDCVPLLCSMKLRESSMKTTPSQLAADIHSIVQQSYSGNTSYYVVIYCCCNNNSAKNTLPRGTIVVPIQTLQKVMYPFGANNLLEVMIANSSK